MAKKQKSSIPLQAPQYRGGRKAMLEFIQSNLRYPPLALEQKIEGVVSLSYMIDGRGKVIEVKVKEGIGYGCDEEAIRLVRSLVFEKVYNRGLKTRTNRQIKIRFKLPEQKKLALKYQLVAGKKEAPRKRPTTYTIQVNLSPKEQP